MTRASSYKEWFGNACRLLILKKTGARWIVDATQTVLLDADSGPWAELKLADAPAAVLVRLRTAARRLPDRCRDQLAVVRLEYGACPRKVVADDADDALLTPPLITYPISTHWMNSGYRQLTREVSLPSPTSRCPKAAISTRPACRQ